MYQGPSGADRINSFALVAYIPDPLASFLDKLRQELVPNCFLRAHITILPPRPITTSPAAAWNAVRSIARNFAPFDVELASVEVFPITDVIYVAIRAGSGDRLREMNSAMNTRGLTFKEPYSYHPHVTLAQDLKPDELDELVQVARQRWAEFAHGREFHADKVVFVQNTRRDEWIDLGECSLGVDQSRLAGELSDTLVR